MQALPCNTQSVQKSQHKFAPPDLPVLYNEVGFTRGREWLNTIHIIDNRSQSKSSEDIISIISFRTVFVTVHLDGQDQRKHSIPNTDWSPTSLLYIVKIIGWNNFPHWRSPVISSHRCSGGGGPISRGTSALSFLQILETIPRDSIDTILISKMGDPYPSYYMAIIKKFL